LVVNVTGSETIAVRAAAQELGRRLGREATFTGEEAPTALLSDSAKMRQRFGPPAMPLGTLFDWVAAWVRAGNPLLGKPTGFEKRDGAF